jgi:hypothetical protein
MYALHCATSPLSRTSLFGSPVAPSLTMQSFWLTGEKKIDFSDGTADRKKGYADAA